MTLCYSNMIKYLGLYVDETLSWDKHIATLKSKLLAPIGILKRLSYTVPKYLLRSVYFSLIHCHIQYLTILWYPTNKKLVEPLQVLQNRAIKNVYSLPLRYSTEYLYVNFNITPLANIYKYQISLYIHQVILGCRRSNLNFNFVVIFIIMIPDIRRMSILLESHQQKGKIVYTLEVFRHITQFLKR